MKSKQTKYKRLLGQLSALIAKSPTFISQLSTINSILFHKMPSFSWVGFYLLDKHKLTVGPYQGSLACQNLEYPNGVCWSAILQKKSIIVGDVSKFPGHIACDSRTKSEIVIPCKNSQGEIIGVLDIDSKNLNQFDLIDQESLETLVDLIRI